MRRRKLDSGGEGGEFDFWRHIERVQIKRLVFLLNSFNMAPEIEFASSPPEIKFSTFSQDRQLRRLRENHHKQKRNQCHICDKNCETVQFIGRHVSV